MSFELLVELAWKSFVVSGLTLVILELTRRRSAGERSWIAHIGLVATLLLPLSVATGPNWRMEALPSVATAAQAGVPAPSPPVVVEIGGEAGLTPQSAARPHPLPNLQKVEQIAPWIYGVPATVMTLLLLVALFRLHGLRRRADVLVEPQWLTALAMAQRRMGFKHATALLVSEDLSSPISWGVVRPIILLDQRAAADTAQAEAIIAHELAHVARLDWLMLILGRLATAVFWFNPLVWLLARRCHELSEQAVDDTVLGSDIRSTDYAQLLIGAARHSNSAVLLAANGMAGSGSLTRRVRRVLDASHSRNPARWGWVVGCCAVAMGVAGPLSALSPAGAASARPAEHSEALVRAITRAVGSNGGNGLTEDRSFGMAVAAVGGVDARIDNEALAPRETSSALQAANAAPADEVGQPQRRPAGPFAGLAALNTPNMRNALNAAAQAGRLNDKDLRALEGLQAISSPPRPKPSLGSDTALADAAKAPGRVPTSRTATATNGDGSVIRDARPLLTAAWHGRLDIIKVLLDAGADVNATQQGEGTPLIKAAAAGHLHVVKYLLERGADLHARAPGGGTALVTASYWGHKDVVRYLIDRGADVNGRRGDDGTPLTAAIAGGHADIAQMLIAAGAGRGS